MLTNYFKTAWRRLLRHRGYALINVVGLAVAMASCILIGLYVWDESSYDRFHEHADRVARVVVEDYATAQPPVAPALERDYPHLVEQAVRLWPIQAPATIRLGDRSFVERRISFADPDVFRVFTFPMRAGDPDKALEKPNSIVLTESLARKYFGDEDAFGQSLQFWGQTLRVTGVIEDVPPNTHYPIDALVSFSTLSPTFMGPSMLENWGWAGFYTYVLLRNNVSTTQAQAAFSSFFDRHTDLPLEPLRLQPLPSIHLHSDLQKEASAGGDVLVLYLLGLVALLVLVMACINYVNLAMARSTGRAKEVGMRRTLGARRRQLVGQFLSESILLSGGALLAALLLVELALPMFNAVAGKALTLSYIDHLETAFVLLGLMLVVGVGAGSYPALFLSRLRPTTILRGPQSSPATGLSLRRSLVVFQFAVSITLAIGAGVVYQQLHYLQTKDLGFDEEHVVVMEANRANLMLERLRQTPGVVAATAAGEVPGWRLQMLPVQTSTMPSDSTLNVRVLGVDYGFLETMGIMMAQGRAFSRDRANDVEEAFIMNRAATRVLGWDQPVGQPLGLFQMRGDTFERTKSGIVIGVTENFNYASLHGTVEPLLIHIVTGEAINVVLARLDANAPREALDRLTHVWSDVNPDEPFDYFFLDDQLDQQYQTEQRLGRIFGGFTALALFIAAFGLFALAAFTARQRTKEIGVRKVLGASVTRLFALLSKDFLRLVLVAFVVAAPAAYLAAQRWLQGFAYRVELSWQIFLWVGLAMLVIALLSVSYQATRAALTDPVESLRYE